MPSSIGYVSVIDPGFRSITANPPGGGYITPLYSSTFQVKAVCYKRETKVLDPVPIPFAYTDLRTLGTQYHPNTNRKITDYNNPANLGISYHVRYMGTPVNSTYPFDVGIPFSSQKFIYAWEPAYSYQETYETAFEDYTCTNLTIYNANNVIVHPDEPGIVHLEHPGMASVYSTSRAYFAVNKSPVLFEAWFEPNPADTDPLTNWDGYTNYLLIGPKLSYADPNNNTGEYIKKYNWGIFKKDADIINPVLSDCIFAYLVTGTESNWSYRAIKNGVVIREETLSGLITTIRPIISSDRSQIHAPTAIGSAYLQVHDAGKDQSNQAFIYFIMGIKGDSAVETYLCKTGVYVEPYVPEALADTRIFSASVGGFLTGVGSTAGNILEGYQAKFRLIGTVPSGITIDENTGLITCMIPFEDYSGYANVTVEGYANDLDSGTLAVSFNKIALRNACLPESKVPLDTGYIGQSVVRVGDLTTGHGPSLPQIAYKANSNVQVNGVTVMSADDSWLGHLCSDDTQRYHSSNIMKTKNSTVFINGSPVVSIGDIFDCGDICKDGSPTLFVGGEIKNLDLRIVNPVNNDFVFGWVEPSHPQYVPYGQAISFIAHPDEKFKVNIKTIGTAEQGTWNGNVWTSQPITEDCIVGFEFSPIPLVFTPEQKADIFVGEAFEIISTMSGTITSIIFETSNYTPKTKKTNIGWDITTNYFHEGFCSMISEGRGDDSTTSTLTATLIGPGILSFWEKGETEYSDDFFYFSIDSVKKVTKTGITQWSKHQFFIEEGEHVVTWEFAKDSYDWYKDRVNDFIILDQFSFIPFDNEGKLVVSTNFITVGSTEIGGVVSSGENVLVSSGENVFITITVNPGFYVARDVGGFYPQGTWNGDVYSVGPITEHTVLYFEFYSSISEYFSAILHGDIISKHGNFGNLDFTTSEDHPWFAQSEYTQYSPRALRSGSVETNQTSSLKTVISGPGVFEWDSASSYAGNNCEVNYFSLNTINNKVLIQSLTGSVVLPLTWRYPREAWNDHWVALGPGDYIISWDYMRTFPEKIFLDSTFLSEIQCFLWEAEKVLVTAVSSGHGSVTNLAPIPQGPRLVAIGGTTFFEVTPDPGYIRDPNVGGITHAGTWLGNKFQTPTIEEACTLTFNFILKTTDPIVAAIEWVGSYNLDLYSSPLSNWIPTVVTDVHFMGDSSIKIGEHGMPVNAWSVVRTWVDGPGVLSFYWKCSTYSWNFLEFWLDGVQIDGIGGEKDWERYTISISTGNHILQWARQQTYSAYSGQDCGWIDEVTWVSTPLASWAVKAMPDYGWESVIGPTEKILDGQTASFTVIAIPGFTCSATTGGTAPIGTWDGDTYTTGPIVADCWVSFRFTRDIISFNQPLTDAVGNPQGLTFSTYGDAYWFNQQTTYYEGGSSLESGRIVEGKSTTLEATVIGGGYLSFYWKISADNNNDFLKFYLDGVEIHSITGGVSWHQISLPRIAPSSSTHTFKWVFNCNNPAYDYYAGSTAGWVDSVVWTPIPNIQHIITPSIIGSNGTLLSFEPITVFETEFGTFTTIPDSTFIAKRIVGGTAPVGTWNGNVYTTGAISEDCTIVFEFEYGIVSIVSVAGLHGSVSPSGANLTLRELSTEFTLYPDSGYVINPVVVGTAPSGTWSGNTYETGLITENCYILFYFIEGPSDPIAVAIADAIGSLATKYTTGGDANWFVQHGEDVSGDGNFIQSGEIANNQSSWVASTVEGPGTLSWWWFTESEIYYDYLRFYIDGVEQTEKISGIRSSWLHVSKVITGTGTHTVKWAYTKDHSSADGLDCGRIDTVSWIPAP